MTSHRLHPSFLDLDFESANAPEQDRLTRRAILCRVGIFGLFEYGFLAFSAVALVHPIILNLPLNISLSEAKGGFTVLSIVWHALAVMAVKDILLFVFSAEWLSQYKQTDRLESRSADHVSKLTTGFLGRIQHFLSRTATTRYRVAMVLTILLMLLGGLGPSTVVVTTVPVDTSLDISLANVTFPYYWDSTADFKLNNTWIIDTRANSILRFELFEKVTFGFQPSDNIMIPWPDKPLQTSGNRIAYKSDVLSFNFTCAWHKPTMWRYTPEPHGSIFWQLWNKTFIMPASTDAFVPMVTWPTTFFGSAWIFALYDHNSSESSTPSLDLSGLPTTSRAELEQTWLGTGLPVPQAVTALVCDPQIDVYTAEVTLDKGVLYASRINHPTVGNIDPQPMLRNLFISTIIPSIASNFPDSIYGITSSTFSSVARLLLFCGEDSPCDTSFKPFPITTINNNMNRFFRSASKAVLDGYNGTIPGVDTLSLHNFNSFTTQANGQEEKMALVASRPFFICLALILTLVTLFLGTLYFLVKPECLVCFNLDNVSRSILNELERSEDLYLHASTHSLTDAHWHCRKSVCDH